MNSVWSNSDTSTCLPSLSPTRTLDRRDFLNTSPTSFFVHGFHFQFNRSALMRPIDRDFVWYRRWISNWPSTHHRQSISSISSAQVLRQKSLKIITMPCWTSILTHFRALWNRSVAKHSRPPWRNWRNPWKKELLMEWLLRLRYCHWWYVTRIMSKISTRSCIRMVLTKIRVTRTNFIEK